MTVFCFVLLEFNPFWFSFTIWTFSMVETFNHWKSFNLKAWFYLQMTSLWKLCWNLSPILVFIYSLNFFNGFYLQMTSLWRLCWNLTHSGFHLQSELFQWLSPPDDLSMEACCAIKYFPEVDSLQSEKVLVISLSLQSEKVLFISLSRNWN